MKKLISVILVMTMVCGIFALPANAAKIENGKTDYPYIFVHGMGGWGSETPYYSLSPYWGGGLLPGSDTDIVRILNENGVEAYAPSVGPLNSAWDRACELFAQLTGTVVDYGFVMANGLAKEVKNNSGLKVLGNGELSVALTVKAAKYSASAKAAIEAAGGTAETL